jgi:hypothetical protein
MLMSEEMCRKKEYKKNRESDNKQHNFDLKGDFAEEKRCKKFFSMFLKTQKKHSTTGRVERSSLLRSESQKLNII